MDGECTLGVAREILPLVRELIKRQYDATKAALLASAPPPTASNETHAVFAARRLKLNVLLEKLVASAARPPTQHRLPGISFSTAHVPAVRALELVEAVQGTHVFGRKAHNLLSTKDPNTAVFKAAIELKNDADFAGLTGDRRWLFGKFLPAVAVNKCFTNSWHPIGFHFTGGMINVVLQQPAGATRHEQLESFEFHGRTFTRANVDELGAVLQKLYGAMWDDVPADARVRVADIVLGLLFERDVTSATGFMVQQIDILPLLDWLHNCARPQFADSFAWLILELRECDPARFCCGMDPGKRSCVLEPCTFFYIKKSSNFFFSVPRQATGLRLRRQCQWHTMH